MTKLNQNASKDVATPRELAAARLLTPDHPAWMEALKRIRHDTYHLPEYVVVEAELMKGRPRAFIYSEGAFSLLVPLVVREVPGGGGFHDATSPYGYPGPVSNAAIEEQAFWQRACAALVATLRTHSLVSCFIRMNPLFETPLNVLGSFGWVEQHSQTVAIDLMKSDDEVWAGYRLNHRRQIRRARDRGLAFVMDDWSLLPVFEKLYHETMRRVGAHPSYFFDSRYFMRLLDALGEHVHLASVALDGVILGGGLFFERDGVVQFHLGATRDDALALQPSKLMFDEVQRWCRHRGVRALHLGGGVERNGNPLFHFKAGFSRWWLDFYTWRLVLDEAHYKDLCADRGVTLHGDFFPAYRKRSE